MGKTAIRTEAAPAPFQGAPYNQAIGFGDLVFVAGQIGLRPGGTAPEGDVTEQTTQLLDNVEAILEAAGSALSKIVKTTVFLTDLGDFKAMNDVYAVRIGEPFPARSTIQVAGLPAGAVVEIEVIAHL
jgi:2-iminobutanoate/2-iminopropanoate deaminase